MCFGSLSFSPLGAFLQALSGLSCVFHWGEASIWPLCHKARIGGGLQWSLSFWKLPISSQDLWSSARVTIGFLVTFHTKSLLPRLLSLAGRPAPGRVLVVPNLLCYYIMEAIVLLGTFNAAFPRSVPRPNPVSELWGQFLRPHGLVFFALTCIVSCETLYRQVCAFPNHVQSIEFTTDADSNQGVETSQRWSRETGGIWAKFQVS